jgi:antitoxin component YwqK of YwqJK toxin-antitoxin module
MIKSLVFILFSISFIGIQVNGQNLKDKDGKRTGKWILYKSKSESSKDLKVEEGVFIHGRKEGQWIKYFEDGKAPKLKGSYSNNRPDGEFIRYYKNGQIKEKGSFSKSKFKGEYLRYHANGNIEYIGNYNNLGEETGIIQYFHKNGNLALEYTVKNAELNGKLTRYFEDGTLQESMSFSENGEIIAVNTFEKKIPEKKIINSEANSTSPPKIKNPKTKSIKFNAFGYNKVYNDNDEIWMDGIFKNGQLWEGKVYRYDKDGILQRVLVYKEGKYHSEGQL